MRRMAMEEPERENIKLPFLQGCKTLCLTKTCTNRNHQSLKSHTLFFLHFRTLLSEYWHFFPPYSNTSCILWTLCIKILPVLQTGVSCGDVCVNMMWAATTSPTVAAKSCMWLSIDVCLYTLKQGFSTCLPMGRWSICGSPKPLWASSSLVPSTWTVTYPPEVKVSVERVSDSLPWGQSASRVRCLVPACCQETRSRRHLTASQHCTLWHSIKVLSLWWHFLLFSC